MNENNYCTTTMAAQILGLSVGTIQKMVSNNELQAWVTQGGHRRILVSSVHEYRKNNKMPYRDYKNIKSTKVIILSDNIQIDEIKNNSIEIIKFKSLIEVLLNISTIKPKILIIDEKNPNLITKESIYIIHNDSKFDEILIIYKFELHEEKMNENRGNSIFLRESINALWLSGFLYAYNTTSDSQTTNNITHSVQ